MEQDRAILTAKENGNQYEVYRTMDAYPPLHICLLAPPRISPTTFSAKTEGSIRGVPSSPRARAAISCSMLLYRDVRGSSKLTPLESMFVLIAPVTMFRTCTSKGAISRRRVSVMASAAALEPA